ncbi:FecR family protein [Mucilaginibacter rigui]|uniref:FecR family protein n=1 Tax=Mucilaginibacter rigui TaxID=534635 RepID=A0ABR7X222_9SPHI|nr:FecR family protein [Mucilaginibacter rigui]MBD1384640.1 FecR family protein [Mucilaginibacter rigui]
MEDESEIKSLLVKYITRQASEDEIAFVKQWIGAHPENEQYFAQLYEAWQNSLLLEPTMIDTDKAYSRFLNTINYRRPQAKKMHRAWLALYILLAAVTIVFIFKPLPSNLSPLNQLAADPGRVRKITLTDGTIIWLNSGSTLRYNNDFGKTNRNVYLEGEGFFEIAAGKKNLPFIVNTKNYIVRDIGTKFNLKAYPNDSFFETAVVTGEVSIEDTERKNNAMNRIYIKQRQNLRIWNRQSEQAEASRGLNDAASKTFNEIQIMQFTPDQEAKYTGWKDNLMIFEGLTLLEIAKVLERRYDVKISIDNIQLQTIRYTGNFNNVGSVEKVLDIIKQNTPIIYSKTGDVITITKAK